MNSQRKSVKQIDFWINSNRNFMKKLSTLNSQSRTPQLAKTYSLIILGSAFLPNPSKRTFVDKNTLSTPKTGYTVHPWQDFCQAKQSIAPSTARRQRLPRLGSYYSLIIKSFCWRVFPSPVSHQRIKKLIFRSSCFFLGPNLVTPRVAKKRIVLSK